MEQLENIGWLVIAIGVSDLALAHTIIKKAVKDEAQQRVVVGAMTLSGLVFVGVGLALALGVFSGEPA